jgi:hypothetical protein
MGSEAIVSALSVLKPGVADLKSAKQFLTRIDLEKPNADRFLSWLIVFGLSDGKLSAITELHSKYQAIITLRFPADATKPLEPLDKEPRHLITVDLDRSLPGFFKFADLINVKLPDRKVCFLHSRRILSALVLADKFYFYTQGYDRYMLLIYLVALDFTAKANLPAEVAESLAFHLTAKVLRLADVPDVLDNIEQTEPKFRALDAIVQVKFPELHQELVKSGHGSLQYALKWRLLLFADEHPVKEVYAIWDSIFVLKESLQEFFYDLCVGHLEQVRIKEEPTIVEQIQRYRDWDCNKLLTVSWDRYNSRRRQRQRKFWLPFALLSVLVLVVIFVAFAKAGAGGEDL